MNELINYFNSNQSNLIHKWAHYFEIYDSYFSKFKNKAIYFVEIGVFDGGSLQMWKKYFGPQANIIGVDINPLSKTLEDNQIKITTNTVKSEDRDREAENIKSKNNIIYESNTEIVRKYSLHIFAFLSLLFSVLVLWRKI